MDGLHRSRLGRGAAGGGRRRAPPHPPRGVALTRPGPRAEDGDVVLDGAVLPDRLAVVPRSSIALGPDLVPTAGTWARSDAGARFTPRFPLFPGAEYVVVAIEDGLRELGSVRMPTTVERSRTTVLAIEPDVAEVPANVLRVAITFSAPMEEGSAAGRIRILDASGTELPGVVLPMPPELWDRDRRRLTVLIEPGRIKRGLQPNVQAGPPFREGEGITVVVDAGLRSAGGAELETDARRDYRVGPAIRRAVAPDRWRVERAADDVTMRFDRPMDPQLLRRCLRPIDATGMPVRGGTTVEDGGRTWRFTPLDGAEAAAVRVDGRLEDLAGNSIRRVFDRDLLDAAEEGPEQVVLAVPPRADQRTGTSGSSQAIR